MLYKGIECVSAGVLFYRYDNNGRREFLFQKINDMYEDFGGKMEPIDKGLEDTAAREAAEESNGKITYHNHIDYDTQLWISKEYIKNLINKNGIAFINKKSKYVVFLVYLPECFQTINFETYEKNNRYVTHRDTMWLTSDAAFNDIKKIHFRIRHLIKYMSNHNSFNPATASIYP